jgi:SOS-response transcriptional repressor LexA
MTTKEQLRAQFSARLNKALDEGGYPALNKGRQVLVAKNFGVSQEAARKWVSGESIPATTRATEIARELKVNYEWLIGGQGPMRQQQANTEPGPDVKGYIPLISWVAAGAWTAVEDPYEVGDAEAWVPCPVTHGNHTFVLRVRGMSMEPEYRDGDWIFVDPDRHAENGSHVVVRLENEQEATFKKLVIEGDRRYLMALNPGWPDRVIEINGNARIVGTVIFSGKPR